MVNIVFHVQYRDIGPACEFLDQFVRTTVFPFHRVPVAADRNGIAHAAENARNIRYAFGAVGNFLAFQRGGVDLGRIQKVSVSTKLRHTRLEGIPGAQRLVVEKHEQCFGAQQVIVINTNAILSF